MTGLNVGASDFVPGSRTFKELAIDSTGPSQQEQADWCEDGEAVARELAALYPQYSAQALRDVLASNGYDWYATLETLEDLERDFARDVRPPDRVQEQQQQQQRQARQEDAFPALGAAPATRAQPVRPQKSSWAALAGAAPRGGQAAAVSAPAPERAARPGSRAPAPIWTSAGAVEKLETGAAVARDYSALRAEASEHARLRNQCYMQVGRWAGWTGGCLPYLFVVDLAREWAVLRIA